MTHLNIRTIKDTGVIVKAIATCKDNNIHQVIIPRSHYRMTVISFYRLGVNNIEELDALLLNFYQQIINKPNNAYSHTQISLS